MDFVQVDQGHRLSKDPRESIGGSFGYYRLFEQRVDDFGVTYFQQVWSGRANDYAGLMAKWLFDSLREKEQHGER